MSLLPDIQSSLSQINRLNQLDWVGLSAVELPIRVKGCDLAFMAQVRVGVNLTSSEARGIHMSRLYNILEKSLPNIIIGQSSNELFDLHEKVLKTQGGLSDWAQIQIDWQMPVGTVTLKSEQATQKIYPVTLIISGKPQSEVTLEWGVQIIYSSTCPQSYALSTQAQVEEFEQKFKAGTPSDFNFDAVKAWLEQGLVATPHAQRSQAHVFVQVNQTQKNNWETENSYQDIGPFVSLIKLSEAQLATASQTLVKRSDEKEFALINAQNTLFCEDAARRLAQGLSQLKIKRYYGHVIHFESLHPFDVRAYFSGNL